MVFTHWLRDLRTRPSLAFLVITLAVSLAGGLTALALNVAVQWRSLPFRDADALVSLDVRGVDDEPRWWSGPELRAVADAPPAGVTAVAGFTVADYNVLSEPGRPPESLLGTLVTPSFVDVLGVSTHLGRPPVVDDYQAGSPRVVVLGYDLWTRRYGADPRIIGRTLRLEAPTYLGETGGDYTVIGVLSPTTWLFWRRTDLLFPLRTPNGGLDRPDAYLIERVIARLEPGGPPVSAALGALIIPRLPASRDRATRVVALPLAARLTADVRPQLQLVFLVACLVLALAFLNALLLVSSDVLARSHDNAVRVALGATPARLSRDVTLQALLTAGVSGLLSVGLASWAIDAMVPFVPAMWLERVPDGLKAVRIDAPLVAVVVATVVAIAVAAGAWALVRGRRLAIGSLLVPLQPVDAPARQRGRSVLVAIEVALGVAAIVIATSLANQLAVTRRGALGVDPDHTFATWLNASPTEYADPDVRATYFDRVIAEVGGVPGVESVGAVSLPFYFEWDPTAVRADGSREQAPVQALDRSATDGYAAAVGLRLVHGRWFGSADSAGAPPVAVVSESLARALGPVDAVVGRTLMIGEPPASPTVTVVGVVRDTRPSPHALPSRTVYRPLNQAPPPSIYLTVRTAPGIDVWRPLTDAVWRVDPDQPLDGPWPLRTWIEDRTAGITFLSQITLVLAALGAVLAMTGLVGLTAHWVQASRRELGVRRAIGASSLAIAWWFARRWLTVVGPASIVGLGLQAAVLRATVASVPELRGAEDVEVAIGLSIAALLALVAAAAALRRALQVSPRDLTT